MSIIKVNKIENTATTVGGVEIDNTGHVQIDGIQMPTVGGLSHRNMLHNGDMRITQRGTAAVTNSGAFPVDRWAFGKVNAGTITAQQVTDTPVGFKKAVQITITTADATVDAGDVIDFQQWIEANNVNHLEWGTANAKNVTLSFWVKASVAGTYCTVILGHTGSAVGHSYVSEYTISAQEAGTWVHKVINIPGPTSGTFATQTANQGVAVRFGLTAGTNFHQAAGSWGTGNVEGTSNQTNLQTTQGATWAITGIQLEVGDKATPFEHRSYGDELARCQRYYQRGHCHSYIYYPGSATLYFTAPFHTEMRDTPTTMSVISAAYYGNGFSASAVVVNKNGGRVNIPGSAAGYNGASVNFDASAEL